MAQGENLDREVTNENFDDELSFAATTFGDEVDSDESSSPHIPSEGAAQEDDSGYASSPRRTSDDDAQDVDGASFIGSFQSDLSCSSGFPHSFGKQLYNARGNSAGGSNALSRTPSAAVSISHSCSTNDNSIHEMSPRIRSRTRSRSKNESKNRRETSLEKSTAVVVRNLSAAPGLHDMFKRQLLSVVDFHRIRDFFIERKTDFAFVQADDVESAKEIVRHADGMKLGNSGVTLSAERCVQITPLQDPKDFFRFGAVSDTLMLKNLPFNVSITELEVAIVSGRNIPTPREITPRLNSTGEFRGMMFVAFHTLEDATTACRRLHGAEILKRKVHAEFKRVQNDGVSRISGGRQRANTLSGGDTYARHSDAKPLRQELSPKEIEEKLDEFLSGKDTHIDFPMSLSSTLRRHVHNAAHRLGLEHSCEKVWDSSAGVNGSRVVRLRKSTRPTLTYAGESATIGPRSMTSSLVSENVDGAHNSYRDCHHCTGGSSYSGDDTYGSYGRHHSNSYSSVGDAMNEKHGFRPRGNSGSSKNSGSSSGSRRHDRDRSGSSSSKHGRGTPTYRMTQNSRPSTPSSGGGPSHFYPQRQTISPSRPRAHTHSGATLPAHSLDNGVVTNAIIRTPKGPDGTRGFHVR